VAALRIVTLVADGWDLWVIMAVVRIDDGDGGDDDDDDDDSLFCSNFEQATMIFNFDSFFADCRTRSSTIYWMTFDHA
jgi:hypothetical protein